MKTIINSPSPSVCKECKCNSVFVTSEQYFINTLVDFSDLNNPSVITNTLVREAKHYCENNHVWSHIEHK